MTRVKRDWLPLEDFCDFDERYPEVGMKGVLMEHVEDYGKHGSIEGGRIPSLKPCKRGIKEGTHWFATLSPDQYSEGHIVIVSRDHFDDIADPELVKKQDVLADIATGVAQCARRQKDVLGAERIYVASLCDGIEHLHVHLIPRYHRDKKGFQFMGDRERRFNAGILQIGPQSTTARAEFLENLARRLEF